MKKIFFVAALLCASMMSFAIDWDAISWMASTDPAYAEKFKLSPATGQVPIEVQNPFGTGLGVYSNFPMALASCSWETGTYQIEGSGLLLFVTSFSKKETEVTATDNNGTDYTFYVYYADGVATGLESVATNAKAVKTVENGQLYLMYNGTKYDVQGKLVK